MRLPALLLVPVLLAAPATAAPRACRLVTDPAGDTAMFVPEAENHVPSTDLDVVSADVATNQRTLTVAIRTTTLTETDPASPTGRMYAFRFTAGGHRFEVTTVTAPDGSDTFVSVYENEYPKPIGYATAVWDYAAREVRIVVPIGAIRAVVPLTNGTRLTALEAVAARHVGLGGRRVALPANYGATWGAGGTDTATDTATSHATYAAGTASCVRIER